MAEKPIPWMPAADGPQATVTSQYPFHVKDAVTMPLFEATWSENAWF